MREKIISVKTAGVGVLPESPLLSSLGVDKMVNVRPDAEGVKPYYLPTDSNLITLTVTSKNSGRMLFKNDVPDSSANTTVYFVLNSGITKQDYTYDSTGTFTASGSVDTVATFSNATVESPCIIEAEGVALISNGDSKYELSLIAGIASRSGPTNVPLFKCGCYFNGQFVVGNLLSQINSSGNWQSAIAWSDVGNTSFTLTESVLNTCTDTVALSYSDAEITVADMTVGYMTLPASCHIIGMHTLGQAIIVLTTDGVFKMVPVDVGWGIVKLASNCCEASCLGDNEILFVDKTEKALWRVGLDYSANELGYGRFLSQMATPRYDFRYFPLRREYQIYQCKYSQANSAVLTDTPTEERVFRLNQFGFYETTWKTILDRELPKYQLSTHASMSARGVANIVGRLSYNRQLSTNSAVDGKVELGPTTFGLTDSFHLRMLRMVASSFTEKTIGSLLGINIICSLDNKRNTGTITADKTIVCRDCVVYPRVSGRTMTIQIIFLQANSLTNSDIRIESLDFAFLLEGSKHRRSNADTTNT